MTAEEKKSIARFIELARAYVYGAYLNGDLQYEFSSDMEGNSGANEAARQEPLLEANPKTGETQNVKTQDSLERLAAEIRSCEACKLHKTRNKAVPGEGAEKPLVMVIGEGPGFDEDSSGRPFVGKAGQLLDKMLVSIGLSRESNCFIANVIKCRPPQNRDPQPDETGACASFLERQIKLLEPRFILCTGRVAGQTLLNTSESIGKLRGKIIDLQLSNIGMTIPLIATYHPSALLRNQDLKPHAWEDLKLLRSALAAAMPAALP
jgi:DNA polymerase